MYKKLTEKQFEKILKVNNKAVIYDSKKYVNFIEAILNEDYFSKRIDINYLEDYISVFEICEEVDKFRDVVKYFSKNSKIAFNFYGIDIFDVYDNHPKDIFDYEPDFDSSVNYFSFISMYLYGFGDKITLDNKVVFDFEEHIDYSYSTIHISFQLIKELMNIYKTLFIKDYKINNNSILNYFNVKADNKKDFIKKLNSISHIENF